VFPYTASPLSRPNLRATPDTMWACVRRSSVRLDTRLPEDDHVRHDTWLAHVPLERWDVTVDCKNPGTWAFHCHMLPHAESEHGMYGMVTALVVQK